MPVVKARTTTTQHWFIYICVQLNGVFKVKDEQKVWQVLNTNWGYVAA